MQYCATGFTALLPVEHHGYWACAQECRDVPRSEGHGCFQVLKNSKLSIEHQKLRLFCHQSEQRLVNQSEKVLVRLRRPGLETFRTMYRYQNC